jgi:hypothetical protein
MHSALVLRSRWNSWLSSTCGSFEAWISEKP